MGAHAATHEDLHGLLFAQRSKYVSKRRIRRMHRLTNTVDGLRITIFLELNTDVPQAVPASWQCSLCSSYCCSSGLRFRLTCLHAEDVCKQWRNTTEIVSLQLRKLFIF